MVANNPPLVRTNRSTHAWLALALAAGCCFVAGLAVSRLLYEGLFPAGGWLGRPVGAIGLAALAAAVGIIVWRRGFGATRALSGLAFLPLLLNLVWLVDPTVELARGRFLFAAGLWLAAVLALYLRIGDDARRWQWLGPLCVVVALAPVYLLTMSSAVGVADTFEFQVVAPHLGIAHPTGYPLYLLLGKLFSLLPFGTVAWRLNLASAVYAVAAAAVVFRVGLEWLRRPLPALLAAVILGLTPIYWSQAIVAEVYALHALVVAGGLWLMVKLTIDRRPPTVAHSPQLRGGAFSDARLQSGPSASSDADFSYAGRRPVVGSRRSSSPDRKTMVALAFLLGLGLTNHLTTLFLLPPAAAAVVLHLWPTLRAKGRAVSRRRSLALLALQLGLAFALPLLLYLYLPLRWAAVNGEPMGLGRFVDWVAGGRFQGALQWSAWLRDPTRRQIVGRLLLDAWGWLYLGLAALGVGWTFWRQWRVGVVLLLTAVGFTFYAINYYVPDLAVFLIPTHVVIAVWLAAGVGFLSGGNKRESTDFTDYTDEELHAKTQSRKEENSPLAFLASWREMLLFTLLMLPALLSAGSRWSAVDQSAHDGGQTWARGVLALPLAQGAAVLADSEKIAPLYYLQQIEGLRPDLDIMVLPDEAAYRAELDARLAAGQPVYLARYLPGLAGVYHLRSAGPLLEVSTQPLTELPAATTPADATFGPLRLVGYAVEPVSTIDPTAAGLTLYWTREQELAVGERTPVIYVRLAGGAPLVVGAHPAGDAYPINAWRPGEIVPDFHLVSLPEGSSEMGRSGDWEIEVVVAPRFTPAPDLAWQPVATVPVAPRPGPVGGPRRVFLDGFALDGVEFPTATRPADTLPLRFSGHGNGNSITFLLVPPHAISSFVFPAAGAPPLGGFGGESWAFGAAVESAESGTLALVALPSGQPRAVCGWLAWPTTGCVVAEVDVSGVALPEDAVNFDDQVALLDVEIEPGSLAPGGQLPVTLTWRSLADMSADYTVFVQVLDAADRIVGQVDAWPVQGTRPTSGWRPGETISDPYVVQLSPNLPPGEYRVIAGLYLLATGQRLAVVDGAGNAVDDKVELSLSID